MFTTEGVRHLKDYFTAAVEKKWKDFCYAIGSAADYNAGRVEPLALVGRAGKLRIGIEQGRPKEDGSGENWPPKNKVAYYIRAKSPVGSGAVIPPTAAGNTGSQNSTTAIPPRVTAPKPAAPDDDVPF